MIVLGIDPGSRLTGYGCIQAQGSKMSCLTHGTLQLVHRREEKQNQDSLALRLKRLHDGLAEAIHLYRPQVIALEKVFLAKNAASALKLGQARGAVVLCAGLHDLEVREYSPTVIKQALTGHGRADKAQLSKMIEMILGHRSFATSDASDALATAMCHATFARTRTRGLELS